MNLRSTAGGQSRFAHLMGLGRRRAANPAASGTDDDKRDDKGRAEEGEDKKPSDEEEDKAKGAEEDPKKDPEDKDDEEDKAEAAATAASTAERARCAAIFAAPEAGANPALAAHLAFETDLTAKQAIGALCAGGAGQARGGLSGRMASAPRVDIGADPAKPAADSAEAHANSVIAAMRKARGQSKGA